MSTRPWFYIDALSVDEARQTAETDGYTVGRVEIRGDLANGLTRYRVYVSEGRGV